MSVLAPSAADVFPHPVRIPRPRVPPRRHVRDDTRPASPPVRHVRDDIRPRPLPIRHVCGHTRRGPWAGDVVVALGAAVAVAGVVLFSLGYRPLVVRSGSMAPAMRVGDLVLSRAEPASALRPGQLVSFRSPSLGVLVTHRVVDVQRSGDEGRALLRVRTRGDANSVGESWTARPDRRLGRAVAVVPRAGWPLIVLGSPWFRIACVVALSGALLRRWLLRIWRVTR